MDQKHSDYLPTLTESFRLVTEDIRARLLEAEPVPVKSWQSVDAPQPMPEILNYSFSLPGALLNGVTTEGLAKAIKPNLPWADDHFLKERVSGMPINPGTTWRTWPYAKSADTHRRHDTGYDDPPFDHSYAERYWPRKAGKSKGGTFSPAQAAYTPVHQGIRFPYGGMRELLLLLVDDPLTRQAYLPVWFPEDLWAAQNRKRVPCTLGYHFIRRNEELHCIYPMRSCDFIRHFRDDVYLTIRLQKWILSNLKWRDKERWRDVKTGSFTMHITSLHCFQSDLELLRRTPA